jgi:hypothetical protein
MRAYAPALTWSQAQGCLTSTAHSQVVDAAAAFTACGLGGIVAAGQAAEQVANAAAGSSTSGLPPDVIAAICAATGLMCPPSQSTQQPPPNTDPTPPTSTSSAFPRPKVKVARRGKHETIRVLNAPSGSSTQLAAFVRKRGKLVIKLNRSIRSIITISTGYAQVQLRFLPHGSSKKASPWTVL